MLDERDAEISESIVMGQMCLESPAFDRCRARLTPSDFGDGFYRELFTRLVEASSVDEPFVRFEFVSRAMQSDNRDNVAKLGYLIVNHDRFRRQPGVFDYHLKQLISNAQRRGASQVAADIRYLADSGGADWVTAVQARFSELTARVVTTSDIGMVGDSLHDTIASIDARKFAERMAATGLRVLDEDIGGVAKGENVVIAGGTGFGKTALALSLVCHNARRGRRVLFFSMEMPETDLQKRILAHESCVDLGRIFRGEVTASDRAKLVAASQDISNWQLSICDKTQLSVAKLHDVCSSMAQSGVIDLIVIDYLQLVVADNVKASLREQVSQLSRDMKLLARQFDCPVLNLCQLSREGAKGEEPQLWHLKESGSIENDADMVWFIYERQERQPQEQLETGTVPIWLKVAKNRRGPVAKFGLQFCKPYQQYRNVMYDATDNPFNDYE